MKKVLVTLGALAALGLPAAAQSQYPQQDPQQYPQQYPQGTQQYPQQAPQYPDRDRGYAQQAPPTMSPDDQREFNKEYDKWQQANSRNDRSDIDKHARRMEDIMARYNIPPNTPFNAIATNGYSERHTEVRDFQGRFSPDDQKRFDKAYEKWLHDRRKHDRDDIARDENHMQEIMARYNIPRDVPYDALSSGGRGY